MDATIILTEVETLAAELFSTTYNLSWRDAVTQAICQFCELQAYAEAWDQRSELMRQNRREVLLMRETGCDADMAIDAVRLSDGKPAWSTIVTPFCFFCAGSTDHDTDHCPKLYAEIDRENTHRYGAQVMQDHARASAGAMQMPEGDWLDAGGMRVKVNV